MNEDLPFTATEALADESKWGYLWLRWACRRDWSLKNDALSGASLRAIANLQPEIHDATVQTIMLKTGIRLGIISIAGAPVMGIA
jgi:hypothetical protein